MDGRHARKTRTQEAILAATREAMRAGIFRPSVVQIAKAAGCSVRSVFQHFATAETLYAVALGDEDLQHAILVQIVGEIYLTEIYLTLPVECQCHIIMAAVYGRIIPE